MCRWLAAAASAVALLAAPAFAGAGGPICADGRASAAVPHSYVAVRRLEAFNRKSHSSAWMNVRTTLVNGRLDVDIFGEGGSEYIRKKVFRRLLASEQELIARRGAAAAFGLSEVTCGEPEPASPGLVRLPLDHQPTALLTEAELFVHEDDGLPARLVARLRRNPSFWVSRVDVEWLYVPAPGGVVVPAEFRSTARVKIYGQSSLRMRYEYLSVNGRPIGQRTSTEEPAR